MSRTYKYNRMTGSELQEALDELHLSRWQLVRLTGMNEAKISRMLNDREDVPHFLCLIVELLALPDAKERAWEVSRDMLAPEVGIIGERLQEAAKDAGIRLPPTPTQEKD